MTTYDAARLRTHFSELEALSDKALIPLFDTVTDIWIRALPRYSRITDFKEALAGLWSASSYAGVIDGKIITICPSVMDMDEQDLDESILLTSALHFEGSEDGKKTLVDHLDSFIKGQHLPAMLRETADMLRPFKRYHMDPQISKFYMPHATQDSVAPQ